MTKEATWLLEEKYGGQNCAAFLADCERLAAGEPLGYVINQVPFLNCTIWLDSRPLIPRVETEFWVEKVLREIEKNAAATPPRLLDLCAGSGCIGIAVAKAIKAAEVTFAEIDPVHLPTIKKNLLTNISPLVIINDNQRGYDVVQSDLFANITGTFDFILSNPPYIDPAVDRAEAAVKAHEPHLALYGGTAGLTLIEQIIATAPAYLESNGQLWLEHEPEQTEAIQQLAQKHGFTVTTHQDQYKLARYSILVLQ